MADHSSGNRPGFALVFAAAALGITIVAVMAGSDTTARAADPARPFKAYAVVLSRDEGAAPTPITPQATPAPSATPPSTPVPTPGAGGEINIQPQLDKAHAVSKLVTYADGATLTTTGADGSQYTLTLPPHSILVDVVVTMTPLVGAGGLPASGGLKAGVQLEPDGMDLGVPATLDIVPANAVSVAEEISFSYSAGGKQAYGYGLGVNASHTRFTLLHFSGWAIAGGDDSQREAFFQSKVDSVSAQLNQDIAAAVAAERARQAAAGISSDDGSDAFNAEFMRVLENGYDTLARPAMDTAEALADQGDIDSVVVGIQAALAWEHEMQVLEASGFPIDSDLAARRQELLSRIPRILEKVINNAYKRCVDNHDLAMVNKLLTLGRSAAFALPNDRALEFALKCATFKLNFETTIIIGSGSLVAWAYQVRSFAIPIHMLQESSFPVARPLELLAFDAPRPSCTFDGSGVHVTDPFVVNSASLVEKWVNGKVLIEDVALAFEMGDMSGSVTWHCPPGGSFSGPFAGAQGMFNGFHISEIGPTGVQAGGWQILGGSTYAEKAYSQAVSFGTERTVLTLKHTPE